MSNERSQAPTPVALRPVAPEDEPFLLTVYASTRATEMALVPWSEAQKEAFVGMQFKAQQEFYANQFPRAEHHLILSNGEPVGRLYVARENDRIEILDITLLPRHRNAGIGTPLIKTLMDEAAESTLPLRIYVESYNPSLSLFKRLGFKVIKEEGHNHLLEWRRDRQDH